MYSESVKNPRAQMSPAYLIQRKRHQDLKEWISVDYIWTLIRTWCDAENFYPPASGARFYGQIMHVLTFCSLVDVYGIYCGMVILKISGQTCFDALSAAIVRSWHAYTGSALFAGCPTAHDQNGPGPITSR
jgi:hypothetical protein